jgi:hypothetical protein
VRDCNASAMIVGREREISNSSVFDAAAIAERIATGETTAADAYRHYAATAARSCARATFAQKLSRARARARRFLATPVETRPLGRPPEPSDATSPTLLPSLCGSKVASAFIRLMSTWRLSLPNGCAPP